MLSPRTCGCETHSCAFLLKDGSIGNPAIGYDEMSHFCHVEMPLAPQSIAKSKMLAKRQLTVGRLLASNAVEYPFTPVS